MLSTTKAYAATEHVLYTFTGLSDGAAPMARLLFDSAGNLYGTASYGGTLTTTV
jgi:hypothetical protein